MSTQQPAECIARIQTDQRGIGQLLEPKGLGKRLLRPPAGRGDHHHLPLCENLAAQTRMLHRLQRQPEIGLTQQHRLDDFRGVLGCEVALSTGKACTPAAQRFGNQRLCQRRCADQPQCALFTPTDVTGQPPEILQVCGKPLGFLLQDARFGGRLELAPDTAEQGEPELLLGMLEDLARRRLGNVQQLGSSGQATGLQDRLEQFDVAKAHGQSSGCTAGA